MTKIIDTGVKAIILILFLIIGAAAGHYHGKAVTLEKLYGFQLGNLEEALK